MPNQKKETARRKARQAAAMKAFAKKAANGGPVPPNFETTFAHLREKSKHKLMEAYRLGLLK